MIDEDGEYDDNNIACISNIVIIRISNKDGMNCENLNVKQK